MDDLRFAIRQLIRRPGVSAVAIFTLAIGMGLTTVAFTAVNSLFKGNAGSRLPGTAFIFTTSPGNATGQASPVEFERFANAAGDAMRLSAQGRMPLAWRHGSVSETVWALLISSDYFPMLDTVPLAGRFPMAREHDVVVVSEWFWKERLGSSPLSETRLTLNGADFAVVGVIPTSFLGPDGTFDPEIWVPLSARRALGLPQRLEAPDHRWLGMVGRLRDGRTPAEAEARLQAAAAAMAEEWPATHEKRGASLVLMRDGHPEVRGLTRIVTFAMLAVGLVLLLAFFNVAGLLLARAVDREREMGIRAALGAGSGRLLRQLLTESLVLAVLAGACALAVAQWSQQMLAAFAIPIAMPQRLDLSTDWRVIGFVGVMVLAAAGVPSLAPAWHAARVDLVRALTSHGVLAGGGRPSRARQLLVTAQVTGSTMMLTLAALFVQSFVFSASVDPGFEVERALVMEIEPALQGYDEARSRLLVENIAERVRALPGVVSVALTDRVPFYVGYPRQTSIDQGKSVLTYSAGPGFFSAMNIPLVAGREFDGTANTSGGVIVSESLAREYFGDRNAVGEVLRLGESRTIIGVARDTMHRDFTWRRLPIVYLPMSEADYRTSVSVVVRTAASPGSLVPALHDAVYRVDPGVPAQSIRTMEQRLELPRWPAWTASGFFGTCGALALVLATVGLFAVISQTVTQRMREFGVRVALGATGSTLLGHVLRGGARMVLPGLVLGLAAAAGLASLITAAFLGVDFRSPLTYTGVAAVQAVIALAACLAPARRAARVDPLTALRAD